MLPNNLAWQIQWKSSVQWSQKDSQQLAKKGLHLVNEPALQVLLLLWLPLLDPVTQCKNLVNHLINLLEARIPKSPPKVLKTHDTIVRIGFRYLTPHMRGPPKWTNCTERKQGSVKHYHVPLTPDSLSPSEPHASHPLLQKPTILPHTAAVLKDHPQMLPATKSLDIPCH